ncbi:enoyl-CoA hydratase/isomerase family protein [Primorskyibacter flagellatus]|uniref:3-hydroxyisobutyryl-CoA hydrolase n=1 Tax=Primorskyibacter flagellatus TaxID=1387277 RepID=A0A1W1ZBM9_9RHOB|nr:enoyl-CoA hydratase/isomerase family protein [Primorskyibacter flagellatus]SMC45834.1 Enoyl-CoA hydratase/carnithine racemase [Primorskyibacter flagellatus]
MSMDSHIRREGRAGRITLTRPKALNALTYDMCLDIAKALEDWRDDPNVDLLILDGQGDKAFCAGGDIAEMYRTGAHGDYAYGRQFWHDEYRMNAALAEYPKPVVSLMQGFTMGGGVGLGGHASHRIVGDSSRISMPECGIGFVPDVGGSCLLARAPGRLGEYLGLTAARMGPGDAIHAGFADAFVPEDAWPQLIATLEQSGDITAISAASRPAPESTLAGHQSRIDTLFSTDTLADLVAALRQDSSTFAAETLKAMMRSSPLSMALTLEMLRRLRSGPLTVRDALALEYRVSWRIMEHGDFLEGIRAAIIDKDRNPNWRHNIDGVPADEVSQMLQPLGADVLSFDGKD